MRPSRSSAALGLLALLVAGPASAARAGSGDTEIESDVAALSARVDEVRRNFTERSGLIGVTEATERYKEAVYQFLIGDYPRAATSFYILVQSNALGNADLTRDSEYYLAECLFEMDDLHTAEEAYHLIVAKAEAHPYFPDAVRRTMEIQALTRQDDAFDQYYTAYIASGRVPPTDVLAYTLGKAFYRRGEADRSRTAFGSLAQSSPYYARAHYFLGVVATSRNDYDTAMVEFKLAQQVPATDDTQRQVAEQAALALARLCYERGDYATASVYYDSITATSPDHADALRESVWTFIRQQRWDDAARTADSFLSEYPSHRYTADMQILRGHLDMKRKAWDGARAAYEKVTNTYGPVAEAMEDIAADSAISHRLLIELRDDKAGAADGRIPAYAEEMLTGRADIASAIDAWKDLGEQQEELMQADRMVAQLRTALARPDEVLTNFASARQDLAAIRGSSLSLRGRLTQTAGGYLRGHLPSAERGAVAAVIKQRGNVYGTTEASAAVRTPEQEAAERRQVLTRYDELWKTLGGYRTDVTDANAADVFARYDRIWNDLNRLEQATDGAATVLTTSEARELEAVRGRLKDQAERVIALHQDVKTDSVAAESVGVAIISRGVESIASNLREEVLQADKGVVDVFWLKKTEVSDAMIKLASEQSARSRELDQEFSLLREGLSP